jgi:hypothetical protein
LNLFSLLKSSTENAKYIAVLNKKMQPIPYIEELNLKTILDEAFHKFNNQFKCKINVDFSELETINFNRGYLKSISEFADKCDKIF